MCCQQGQATKLEWVIAHARETTDIYVRRITARAIPPTGRLGSEGHPGVNA